MTYLNIVDEGRHPVKRDDTLDIITSIDRKVLRRRKEKKLFSVRFQQL